MGGMLPDDIYELRWVSDPRLTPDGHSVAFVDEIIDRSANAYRSRICVTTPDGSSSPRPFTSGDKRDSAPRWSPDGSRLAFLSNRDTKTSQLHVISVSGGEARRLTDLAEDVEQVTWSPDGGSLAFSARVPDDAYEEKEEARRAPRRFRRLQFKLDDVGWTGDRRRHLFVVPADGSAPARQITFGDYEDSDPAWSADGSRIVFSSGRDEDWDVCLVRELFEVDAAGGEPRRLTSIGGDASSPQWSPEGDRIAFYLYPDVEDEPLHTQVAVLETSGGRVQVLTESLDLQCRPYPELREPLWDRDHILFAVEQAGNIHLYKVLADGSAKPEPVLEGEHYIGGYDSRAGVLVHTSSVTTRPQELFRGERRLTDVTSGFTSGRTLCPAERYSATSSGGAEVDGWIVRPADFDASKSYPVLLSIHGGPFAQYGNGFFDEFQVYAAAGYVVLFSNPRGSSGYSEEWGRAIRGPGKLGPGWGSVDYDDVMAVTDAALERFSFCDGDRLGVLGGSYGGYLTSWVVSHTDRFKAACSERSVNDFYTQWGSSDFGWTVKGYTGSYLFEDRDAYLAMSPHSFAQDIHTPLLILHSENDLRCNIEQAEQLFTTLRVLGREVEMVRFPAESHELSRSGSPAHRVKRFEVILEWFDRHLM
jgi:dipeptidyl aminopeptidase/acylaminoacyl peptidase